MSADENPVPIAATPTSRGRGRPRGGGEKTYCSAVNEYIYTDDEIEFMLAVDQYKRDNRRPYPTCAEVLQVARALGYRKVE